MIFLKVTLFVVFVCLVSAIPDVRKLDLVNGWKQTAIIKSQTSILDGSLKQVAFINITVATWNYTQDSYHEITESVRRNLVNIPTDSKTHDDSLRVYEGVNAKLPLVFNMTLQEIKSIGPKPSRSFAYELLVDVFAKKQHRSDILESLKIYPL